MFLDQIYTSFIQVFDTLVNFTIFWLEISKLKSNGDYIVPFTPMTKVTGDYKKGIGIVKILGKVFTQIGFKRRVSSADHDWD
jgi:hypothetical protein